MELLSWRFSERGLLSQYDVRQRPPAWTFVVFVLIVACLFAVPEKSVLFKAVTLVLGFWSLGMVTFPLTRRMSKRTFQFSITDTGISVEGRGMRVSHTFNQLGDFRFTRTDPKRIIIRLKVESGSDRMSVPWYDVPLQDQLPENVRAVLLPHLAESTVVPNRELEPKEKLFIYTLYAILAFAAFMFVWFAFFLTVEYRAGRLW